jgi:site-specific recombinase XerD
MFHLGRFVDHLIGTGVIVRPASPAKEPTALDLLREEYYAYLRKQRGLSESTIYHCMRFLERFITFRFGETLGDLDTISPEDIVTFFGHLRAGSRPYRGKSVPSHLRNLFQFLFWSGRTRLNLANSIPRVAHPQPVDLPRYLRPQDIRLLIETVRTDDAIGRRNYAMLLLLARLGLRAPEVIAIQLDDIDWHSGELLIRGKGKLHDRMPLVADVGEAIVDYIKNGRAGTSRFLFVSSITPHRPFKDAQILNAVLKEAFEKTGLKPPQKYVGSHLLRHSLATDMLRNGASLDEIGDILRHRSRMTTTIYAKHDINALQTIARDWPVQGGA